MFLKINQASFSLFWSRPWTTWSFSSETTVFFNLSLWFVTFALNWGDQNVRFWASNRNLFGYRLSKHKI